MITTIRHFFEGFFATLGEQPKVSKQANNSMKSCCKKEVVKAISNKEHRSIFKNSPNKTIVISAFCGECRTNLNISVNCNSKQ